MGLLVGWVLIKGIRNFLAFPSLDSVLGVLVFVEVYFYHLALYVPPQGDFMKQVENRKHVLGELQRAFDKKVSASDILDSKLQNILNYSSIIVAVFASIITSALLGKIGFFYWFGLIVVVALYIWTYICIKQGTAATTFYNPISNTEQELNEKFIGVRETSALLIFE